MTIPIGMAEKKFIESLMSKGSQKIYRLALKKFKQYTGKNLEELLEERKNDIASDNLLQRKRMENTLIGFYKYLAKNMASSSARTFTLAVQSFFSFYGLPVRLKNLPKQATQTQVHRLNIEDLRAMFQVGNLMERTILSLAKDFGIRVGDFCRIKKPQIEPLLEQKAPIEFKIVTKKRNVTARCHISEESLELLKIYLPTVKGKKLFPITPNGINKLLNRLANKAQLKLNGKLTFKCFRRLFLSTCANCGINQWNAKMMCGKSVPQDVKVYLDSVDLRSDFAKVQQHLTISEPSNHERIITLEDTIIALTRENESQKRTIEILTKKIEELEGNMKRLNNAVLSIQKQLAKQKEKLFTVS